MAEENSNTENQDEALGEGGKRALEAERRARREAEQALRKANDRIAEFERADVVREVAAAKGLSPAMAKRLHGTTREELEADADELAQMIKPEASESTSKPKERLRAGAASDSEPVEDAAEIARKVLQ